MYIIYAKQHFGACWSWKSLTQRKYLVIQLLINPFILFNKFLVKDLEMHRWATERREP